jgi:hypothetical protein
VVSDFNQTLQFGQAGESDIATWLRQRGWALLPAYEKIFDTGKGPVILLPSGVRIAPDFLTWNGQRCRWVEAKHKSAFTWYRKKSRWVTGIDKRHYEDYLKVEDESPWPVWLLFLHDGGQAKDSPPDSPRGLFGNSLAYLRVNESHRHDNWGPSGMVYWADYSLKLLAEAPLRKPVAQAKAPLAAEQRINTFAAEVDQLAKRRTI